MPFCDSSASRELFEYTFTAEQRRIFTHLKKNRSTAHRLTRVVRDMQVAFGSSSTRNSGPEGFEQMSDVAFEREYKIMDARLEESRAKQDESRAKQEENRAKQEENRPIQKQLLMEAERERRTSLR